MKYREKPVLLISLVLIALALSIYLCLSYVLVEGKEIPDDSVTWLHVHLVNHFRRGLELTDYSFSYPNGTSTLILPMLLDILVALSGVKPGYITLLLGVTYIVAVFIVSLKIAKNPLVAAASSILFATTPSFIYWFKYNNYGAYTLQPLLLLVLLLFSQGFATRKYRLLMLGICLSAFLWLSWSEGWLLALVYSLYIVVLTYRGVADKWGLAVGVSLLALSLSLELLVGMRYVTVYHVFSCSALAVALLVNWLTCWVLRDISGHSAVSAKLVGLVFPYAVALCIAGIASYLSLMPNSIRFIGTTKTYSPVFDYGIIGLFSLLAVITVVRSKILYGVPVRVLEFMLISLFAICIILAYGLPSLSVIAVAAVTPFIALGLLSISSSLYKLSRGRTKYFYTVVALWILIGSIASNTLLSFSISTTPSSIYYADVPRKIAKEVNRSSILEALESIKGHVGNALFISYWGYSRWIVGYLNGQVYTLADTAGPPGNQRLVSQILMSDEEVAYSLIKKLVRDSNLSVYIMVSEVISIDLKAGANSKTVNLGAATAFEEAMGRPVLSFRVFGDVSRTLTYAEISGYSISDYIDISYARYHHEIPLSWSSRMLKTLLVKLIVNGLNEMGYTVINAVYSRRPIEVEKPVHFELVSSTTVPMYKVESAVYKYQVYSYTAIYKVKP